MTITGTDLIYSINELDEMYVQAQALASTLRLSVLKLLATEGSLYINEIAERLHQPPSTVALNVRVLESAGLIVTEVQPGTRGGIRRCSQVVGSMAFTLHIDPLQNLSAQVVDMPIGGYTDCQIEPVCGLLSAEKIIGQMHQPEAFFLPERFSAQLIWFSKGYLEYRFPLPSREGCLDTLQLAVEACSEAPHHCNDWPSDISVWVEGVKIGTWRCPGDFGGRQGNLTPEWWPQVNTQFGQLKTWSVTRSGSMLDGEPISQVRLGDLHLVGKTSFTLRIGIEDGAECTGGMNLFGERFGDYPHGLRMHYLYQS